MCNTPTLLFDCIQSLQWLQLSIILLVRAHLAWSFAYIQFVFVFLLCEIIYLSFLHCVWVLVCNCRTSSTISLYKDA